MLRPQSLNSFRVENRKFAFLAPGLAIALCMTPLSINGSASTRLGNIEAPAIKYTISFPDIEKHSCHIKMLIPTSDVTVLDLRMARWSPGFYRVENYAKHVSDVSARTAGGKQLLVQQPRDNHWLIQTEGVPEITVSYRLQCEGQSVTTNWVSEKFALLNGPASFLMIPALSSNPHEISLLLPDQWKASVAALQTPLAGVYRADNYDDLVDSPIIAGNPKMVHFEVAGCKHTVAAIGEVGDWDLRRAASDFTHIVRAQQKMWGFLPSKSYVFLCVCRKGGGGLEHKNSTLLTTAPGGPPESSDRWLSFVSHEYFHAYNAKRLRPAELSVVDYEHEPKTSGLWIAEGLTCYYDDLLVTRAGLSSARHHLAALSKQINQLQQTPGRRIQSLEQASLNVWTTSFSGIGGGEKTVSYYVKGPVVGFLLDAKIRRATLGKRTLDDVMRLAYKRFSRERGYTASQFRETAEEIANIDLRGWFRLAISTTEELQYEEALDWYGLQFAKSADPNSSWELQAHPNATTVQKHHLNEWLNGLP